MAAPVAAAALSAAPSIMSAMQTQAQGTPMYMPTMTPAQYAQLNQMLKTGTQLSPLQKNTLQSMMQGGTAADYGTDALESYYQNTLRNPAMQELYSETLPSVGNRLASKYWSSIRPQEQNKAELATRTQLQKTYGELQMQNELQKRQAMEESRTTGMGLLGQMQAQTLAAKPFDIIMQPGKQSGLLSQLFGMGKGSVTGEATKPIGQFFGA